MLLANDTWRWARAHQAPYALPKLKNLAPAPPRSQKTPTTTRGVGQTYSLRQQPLWTAQRDRKVLLGRSDPDAGWRSVVAEALSGRWSGRTSYRIRAVANEIATWAERAPRSAWNRRQNSGSLLLDLQAAQTECGGAVRRKIDAVLQPMIDALEELRHRGSDKPSVVARLDKASRILSAALSDPGTRVAAWIDVVDAGRMVPLDPERLTVRVEILMELITGAGGNPGEIASGLINVVWPADLLDDPEGAPKDWSDVQRIDAGAARVRESGRVGQCVVWLDFHEARIPYFITELGKVTLFDAEWCVGNATGPADQHFPFKDELVQAWDLQSCDEPCDSNNSLARQVIARVDLGKRSTHRAVEDAEQTVTALNVIIPALTGAPSWQRGEHSAIVVGGVLVESHWGPPRGPWPEPDHYGLNGFSDALQGRCDLFTHLLSQPLPVDVAEALRLIDEAGQVDSRENALNRTATIADRTVLVLQVSALERIAIYGQLSSEEFVSQLAARWPQARYWSLVRHAVKTAVGHRGDHGSDLSRIYTFDRSRRGIDLRTAYELRQALIDDCRDRIVAAGAAHLVHSLGDAPAALAVIAALHDESTRLHERALRCRNALMHGSPVSDSAVLSVRPFVRYLVDSALNMTLESLSSGKRLPLLLEADADRTTAETARLAQGHSHYEMWTTLNQIES